MRVPLTMLVLCGLGTSVSSAQDVGPSSGAIMPVGGALRDTTIWRRFIDLAGGIDVPFVVIPTAGGAEAYDQYWAGARTLKMLGATDVVVVHTYDRDEADTDRFAAPVRRARGVWFGGGRQWRLADSYLDTKVHEALWNVLERGGVIAGSSAGATILGSYLARGDTRTNTVMMGDHEVGLGFLRNVAIDQHLLKRNRQFDMIEIIEARPELLGLGLDENTALVIRGDTAEVLGATYVAVYDAQRQIDSGGLFYFLAPGDRLNLSTREAFRPGRTMNKLERVEKRRWP